MNTQFGDNPESCILGSEPRRAPGVAVTSGRQAVLWCQVHPPPTGRSAFVCMIKDSIDLSLANLAFVGRGTANPLSIQRGFGHLWSLRQNASSALPKPRHWLFGGGQRSRGRSGHVPG